jgi:glutathione S-transferase/RNA polymerase-associated protein
MKLYDNPTSPYAFKVRAVLYEKGIDVEHHEILRESQRGELLAVSPRGEVPALVDGDAIVYDSTLICEYLEERHPSPPLLPADSAGRARVRALERWADMQLDGCVIVFAIAELFRPEVGKQHPDALRLASEALDTLYGSLDARLSAGDWLLGDFTRADLAVAPHVAVAAFMGHGIPARYARLTKWAERLNARPSIARATQEALGAFEASQSESEPFFSGKRLHWRDARIEWAVRCGLGAWLLEELAADRAYFSPVA